MEEVTGRAVSIEHARSPHANVRAGKIKLMKLDRALLSWFQGMSLVPDDRPMLISCK